MSKLVNKLQSYYREEEGTYLIEIKLNQLQQVFNSLDPSPFLDRDLDDNAENYIINSVDEFPLNTPLKLVFYLKCRVKTLSLTDGMKPDQYRTALRQAQ